MLDEFEQTGGLVFSVNKPLGWTSFDVVKKIRVKLSRLLNIRKLKVGHAGTLDPLANGVLVICVGNTTKKIEAIQATEKEYIAQVRFGATTPSYDKETEENFQYQCDHITQPLIEGVLPFFTGIIEQIPPLYSAVKIDGERAYKIARKGEERVLLARNIFIRELQVLNFELPLLTLKIVCGKGTYIRSLARDLGEKLNSGAYLEGLTRTRVGDYTLEKSITIEEFEKNIDQYYNK